MKQGVYCLKRSGVVVYVGRTSDLSRRIAEHRRNARGPKWDSRLWYPCKSAKEARSLEAKLIAQHDPEHNRNVAGVRRRNANKCEANRGSSFSSPVPTKFEGHLLDAIDELSTRTTLSRSEIIRRGMRHAVPIMLSGIVNVAGLTAWRAPLV